MQHLLITHGGTQIQDTRRALDHGFGSKEPDQVDPCRVSPASVKTFSPSSSAEENLPTVRNRIRKIFSDELPYSDVLLRLAGLLQITLRRADEHSKRDASHHNQNRGADTLSKARSWTRSHPSRAGLLLKDRKCAN